jgi:hypothetical protein
MNIIKSNLKFNGVLQLRKQTNKIILHHAEASVCSVQDIHNWHLQNGWIGIGYAFFVRKDGTIYEGRPINTIGSHCLGSNLDSIGICAEGNYMTETMPDIQKQAIVDLIKYIKNIYGNLEVGGHKQYSPSECPGTNYPLQEVIDMVNKKEEPKHFASDSFKYLQDNGIIINEERFNDKITRGEIFVLLAQVIKFILNRR